jgi:hypothetical protein
MIKSSKALEKESKVPVHKDTWILELPDDVCVAEGFPKGTMASLTVKGSAIRGSIVRPSKSANRSAKRFIEKYGDFMREIEDLDR